MISKKLLKIATFLRRSFGPDIGNIMENVKEKLNFFLNNLEPKSPYKGQISNLISALSSLEIELSGYGATLTSEETREIGDIRQECITIAEIITFILPYFSLLASFAEIVEKKGRLEFINIIIKDLEEVHSFCKGYQK